MINSWWSNLVILIIRLRSRTGQPPKRALFKFDWWLFVYASSCYIFCHKMFSHSDCRTLFRSSVYSIIRNSNRKDYKRGSSLANPFFGKKIRLNVYWSLICEFPVPITSVWGVMEKQALLPCDITPMEREEDAVFMVLWFREGSGEPLYRY